MQSAKYEMQSGALHQLVFCTLHFAFFTELEFFPAHPNGHQLQTNSDHQKNPLVNRFRFGKISARVAESDARRSSGGTNESISDSRGVGLPMRHL